MQNLTVCSSPHIRSGASTSGVMLKVIIALCPALVASGIIFGIRAILLTAFCALTAAGWEALSNIIMKRKSSVSDLSAVVTGILLAFNLPVTIPLWMAAIGTFAAIVVAKQIFGGLGQNFANPAIVGRIVLLLSFSSEMTRWVEPFYYKVSVTSSENVVTSATPLVSGNVSYSDLFLGKCGGCIGEVCAAALLVGGIFLVVTKTITPHAPIAFIATVFVFSELAGEDGLYQILSGGLMLGAIFMATDYVTTPITPKGKLIFGFGCGIITCVIRFWCSAPEGVSYSILLMNIVTPYIDLLTKNKPVGALEPEKKKEVA